MRRTFVLAVLAIMAVAGSAFAIGEARMQGKITDAATNKPIPNAVIIIDAITGHKVHTEYKADKDGVYRFLILDGTLQYKVTYKAEGYAPVEYTFKPSLGETNIKDVTMAPGSAAAPATAAPASGKSSPAVAAYNEGASLADAPCTCTPKLTVTVSGVPETRPTPWTGRRTSFTRSRSTTPT